MEYVIEEPANWDDRRMLLLAMLCIGIGLVAMLALAQGTTAEQQTYNWPAGHTVVGTETYTNDTINCNGDININAGTSLVLQNTTLTMSNWAWIWNSGTLEVTDLDGDNTTTSDRSTITAPGNNRHYMVIWQGSNLLIENSYISRLEFMDLWGTNNTITGNLFENNRYSIHLIPTGTKPIADVHNNTFNSNDYAIFIQSGGSTVNFTGNWVKNSLSSPVLLAEANVRMADNIIESNPSPQVRFYGNNNVLHMDNDIVRSPSTGGYNVYIYSNGGPLYVYIDNCQFLNALGRGLDIEGSGVNRIKGNINDTVIDNSNEYGNYIYYSDFIIDNLKINHSSNAGLSAQYSNLNISNSKFTNNGGRGIWFRGSSPTTYFLDLDKVESSFNGQQGIYVENVLYIQADNSTFKNNSFQNIYITNVHHANFHFTDATGSVNDRGIYVSTANFLNITDGKFSYNDYTGISLTQINRFKILRNTVQNNYENAIWLRSTGSNGGGILQSNTIQDNSGLGIYVQGDSDHYITIDQNTIKRNNGFGIQALNAHINLTKNTIRNSNNYQMYVENLQPGSLITGNDIRDGNSIGFYAGYSYISKFDQNTIINHSNSYAANFYYIYSGLSFTRNVIEHSEEGVYYYDWLGGDRDLIIENNTITNTTDNNALYVQLQSYNAVISFQNNKIFDNYEGVCIYHYGSANVNYIKKNKILNTENNWALQMENQWSYSGYASVENNVITNFEYGIYLYGPGKTDIRNNDVSNGRYYGLYAEEVNGPLNVTDNTVTGNADGGEYATYFYSAGWLEYPAKVQRNDFSGNPTNYGMYLEYFGDTLIEYNLFNDNEYGVEVRECGNLIARHNQYNNNSESGGYYYDIYGNAHFYDETANWNNNYGLGIWEIYDGNLLIDNSSFIGNSDEGLDAGDVYDGWFDIENCIFDGGYYPVYAYYAEKNFYFHDNYVANGTEYGLEFDYLPTSGTIAYIFNNHFFMNNYHLYSWDADMIIENNLFERGRYGIDYEGQTNLFIFRNNTMSGIGEENIYLDVNALTAGSGIYDNTFRNFGLALYFESNAVKDLPVFNNVFMMGRTAIELDYVAPSLYNNTFKLLSVGINSYRSNAKIYDSTFMNCWDYCIGSWDDKGLLVSGSDFSYSDTGIISEGSLITVADSTFTQNTHGMKISASFATVKDNSYEDNEYGLYIDEYSFVTITNGQYLHNLEYGIYSEPNTFSTLDIQTTGTVTGNRLVLNGDLTIQPGGRLVLTDSNIQLRSVGSVGYSLLVKSGGTLEARGTTFQPFDNTRSYGIVAEAGSTLYMDDCDLLYLGGGSGTRRALFIETSDVTLEKVTIDQSADISLYIDRQVSFAMRNGTINGSKGLDVFIQNASTLRMGNTQFSTKNVKVLDTSMIIIERLISLEALDDANLPYQGVAVTVTDETDSTIEGTTDPSGMWFRFFEGAILSSTGMTNTKVTYDITVTDGEQDFTDSVTLSEDIFKTYRFGIAPVSLDGTTAITMDEDTIYTLDMGKYFFDNDAMTFSTEGTVSTVFTFAGQTATITPAKDWYGHEDMYLVATDTHDLTTKYALSITVRPVNDPPEISGVPNLIIDEDTDYRLDLLPFIYDPDTPQSGLTVTVSTIYAKVDRTTVTFDYPTPMIEFVRLTVKDSDGGTSQDILVSVKEKNDPPRMKGVPVQNAVEDIETEINFATWLVDEDNNVSQLVLSSSSPFVVKVNGTKATFLFPQGPDQRFVALMVSDGEANTTYMVEFFVQAVNDAPQIGPLPLVTVIEGEEYLFDLSPYVSDEDTNLSKLIASTSSSYITVDGLILVITIPESGPMMTVVVTVSDSFLLDTGDLRISIRPVNDPPELLNPAGPKDGTTGSNYKFRVTVKDIDSKNPVVYVVVDGKKYAMSKVSGDLATGAVYEINLKSLLKEGGHSYHFEVDDGSGEPNGVARTEDVFGLDVAQETNYWWIIVLIVVIVIVAIALLLRKGKGGPDNLGSSDEEETGTKDDDEEPEEEEEEPEEDDDEDDAVDAEEVEEEEPEPPRKKKGVSRR